MADDKKKIHKDDLKKLVGEIAGKLAGEPGFCDRVVKTAVTKDLAGRNLHAKQTDVRRFVGEAVHDALRLTRFTARLRYGRMSERKMRLVVDQIRGKDVNRADSILKVSPKRAAYFQRKLLQSAIANATYISGEERRDLDVNKLTVVRAEVTPGPVMKRTRPSSERRPYLIKKRMCHAILVLEEREPAAPKQERGKKKTEVTPKSIAPAERPAAPAEPPKKKAGKKMEEKK